MRARALLLVALLAPFASAQGALPEGCRAESTLAVCEWRFDTTQSADFQYVFEFPVRSWTLATLTIELDGFDNGWQAGLYRGDELVSATDHPPSGAVGTTRDTTIHLLVDEEETEAWNVRITPESLQVGSLTGDFLGAPTGRSSGSFHVVLVSEALPIGISPERPAATREVPQLLDTVDYAAPPDLDLEAAWFDDPFVGDGLLSVSVAVRDTRNLSFEAPLLTTFHFYHVDFSVRDTRYALVWRIGPQNGEVWLSCSLSAYQGNVPARILTPRCEMDREEGVFVATIPERSVGNPGRGEPFHDLAASSGTGNGAGGQTADVIRGERFAFALGGPAVWDGLNGGVFVPAPVAPLQWYEAPLAEENLPDTLQVLGAVAALLTFLFGVVVLRRRRRQTRKLLDEIERVERAYEQDAHAALLALGELEAKFTRLFRAGNIQEPQYQVVSQRIASVATRFALRRELGLDDGEPGDVVHVKGRA